MNYYSIACLLQDYICDNVVFTCPLTFEFFFHSIDITLTINLDLRYMLLVL